MGEGLQYHIRCKDGDVARYVLLPGDPDRTDLIAKEWDEARFIAAHREYRTWTGAVGGVPVSACSTGIGGPSASIALEELASLGADTFIRFGTCGALQEGVQCGDLIVCDRAMRQDGASPDYVDITYPAAASYEVTAALVESCERLGLRYHVGVSCSTASFYCGQARPGFKGYKQSWFQNKIEDLVRAGVMCFEMEAATVLALSSLYGLRAGVVLVAVADRRGNTLQYIGMDRCIQAANEAVKVLASWDRIKTAKGKKHWFPGLMEAGAGL